VNYGVIFIEQFSIISELLRMGQAPVAMNHAGKKAYAADANRWLPQDNGGFRAEQNIRERRI
jgi:hypothetical protein